MEPACSPEAVQSLPQELQDIILELTLIASLEDSPGTWPPVVKIRDTYRAPWQLSVNRDSRKKVAESYYSRTAFDCDRFSIDLWVCMPALERLRKWLGSLSKTHLEHIRELRMPLLYNGQRAGFGTIQFSLADLSCRASLIRTIDQFLKSKGLSGVLPSLRVPWNILAEDRVEVEHWMDLDDINRLGREMKLVAKALTQESEEQQEQ